MVNRGHPHQRLSWQQHLHGFFRGKFFQNNGHVNWAIVDQAMVSGVNFLTGILLARFLGLEEFGRFTLVWMIILFAGVLQMALIISPMMSIGPQQDAKDEPAYYGAVVLQQGVFLVFGFITIGLSILFCESSFPHWHLQGLALPIAAVLVAFQLQEFLRRYFYTVKRPVAAFVNDAISYLGQLLVLLALFFSTGLNTPMVLWIIAATSGVAAAVGVCILGEMWIDEDILRAVLKRHWTFSKWLVASAIMQWMSGNYLILTAGAWLGAPAVGALKAAQNLIAVTHILFNAMSNFVPVRLGELLSRENLAAMEEYLLKVSLWGGIATLLLMLPAVLIPDLVLKWLYGDEFVAYGWVSVGFAVVYLFVYLMQQVTLGLRALEETRPVFVGYLLTALISVLGAYPLITLFGLGGVIGGMILLNVVNTSILFWGYRMKRREVLAVT